MSGVFIDNSSTMVSSFIIGSYSAAFLQHQKHERISEIINSAVSNSPLSGREKIAGLVAESLLPSVRRRMIVKGLLAAVAGAAVYAYYSVNGEVNSIGVLAMSHFMTLAAGELMEYSYLKKLSSKGLESMRDNLFQLEVGPADEYEE